MRYRSIKIKTKILAAIIPLLLILGVVIMFLSARALREQGEQSLATIESVLKAEKNIKLDDLVSNTFEIMADKYRAAHDPEQIAAVYEDQLQSIVDLAYSSIEGIYKDETIPDYQKKQQAIAVVRSMRYGNGNYLWINDLQPAMVMHPIKPELDGSDLGDFKDPEGKKLFVEMAEVARRDAQGFVAYKWPKPGEDTPVAKLSFVKLFKPWDWVIGTGVYLESAERIFKQEAMKQIGKLRFGLNNDDYFFIIDTDARMVMHPIKPALDGQDVSDTVDENGTRIFSEMVEVVKQDGQGYVSYLWPKSGTDKPVPKQSFVKLFKEWGWIVGTGIYIDDIDKAMAQQQKHVTSAIKTQRLWLISACLLMILIVSAAMVFVAVGISSPIKKAADMLKDIAEGEGDLTQRMVVATRDELADMATWFNTFIQKLQSIISSITLDASGIKDSVGNLSKVSADMSHNAENTSRKSDAVAAAVEQMSANMSNVAQSMEQTAANVDMVASAVEEMTSTIHEIAETSEKARAITNQAVDQTSSASVRVDELGAAAEEINKVLDTITEISDQVDLLALNATIEAARAGDAGKGFAVVANEIKALATQTAEAAEQIKDRIEGIQRTTEATMSEIDTISRVVGENSEIVNTIATAVEEQSATANEISKSVSQISTGIQEINVNIAESSQVSAEVAGDIAEVNDASAQMSKSSQVISEQAGKLNELASNFAELVSRFKV